MPQAARSAALRPEPVALSQAKPAAAIADTADCILRDLFCGDEVDVALAGNPARIDAMLGRVYRYLGAAA